MKRILPVLFLFISYSTFSQDLSIGLRAYYPFTGNANDASGNNNNPVFNNATLTADRFGNPNSAYHFNGTDSYMQILNNPTINMGNTLSVCAWVKATGYYSGPCHGNSLFMKGNTDYLPGNYFMRFDEGAYSNYTNCSGNPVDADHQNFYAADAYSTPPGYTPYVTINEWHCVVATYDGTTTNLYVDCQLKATRSQTETSFSSLYDLYIGKMYDPNYPYWLNGDLDEIRIYDRALTLDEVNLYGGCSSIVNCNNWLKTQVAGESVKIGDLDISGDQITVEAQFNRTAPYVGGYIYGGDIVSKHSDPSHVNYLLRPNDAEITTTTGYYVTAPICEIELNKTYHVAFVYNGSTLKFYRDGFLMSQVAATGILQTNDFITTIGDWANYSGVGVGTNFQGTINEVRIWNVARTQSQIQAYMNTSLPNPTTQTGLIAYYTFDDLINKQGNNSWNGTLNGAATINNTNPNCSFSVDSCHVVPPTPCNTWLHTQAVFDRVTIGDLDVAGNQITVEANFNCTSFPIASGNIWEDIVSKHSGPADCNYALRMDIAAIATTNGFFRTGSVCQNISLNKTYHVALVYDGSSLKFYRDGFLLDQIAASGNLSMNDWPATIGDFADNLLPSGTNFFGYINEVRIWNVARTQSQIQAYMNASLPNPTTQTGLLAYYTFDNLINKQGNTAWNGILNGGATINNTNPNCSFTADSCNVIPTNTCNTWLATPTTPSFVTIGDLDIAGSQLTIEATANRTSFSSASVLTDGDLVSKHTGPPDANYILRPTGGLISTSNGFFATPNVCEIELNKTYHYAMTYDGATLKFYRDGFLMSQIAATGNLVQNNLLTSIGLLSNQNLPENFIGYINEVRIWNVARTQSQIQAYMNTSLPNPTTQTGLLAYYTFDNLVNKQGNTAWNGTPVGAALINSTNPDCTFIADSCAGSVPCSFAFSTNITDAGICPGGSVHLAATGAATGYSWSPVTGLSDPHISNPVATPNTSVTYTVTATLGSCQEQGTIIIHVFPPASANAGPDKTIDAGDQVMLDGSGSSTSSIVWTPANTLTGANSFTPIANPAITTTYTLTVTDNNNCTAKDDVKVIVKELPCEKPADPLHAFTPNGDGIHDKWIAYTGGACLLQVDVRVYNRYGTLVYRNGNYQNDWEGTYKNKTLPDGTYYYVNTYKLSNGRSIEKRGDVTILR